ncbi:hypothetical protein COU00_02620 [Candidatus Falkowbacteria bacterium CG10_big_fil_rev_8_21_14_0_10_43_11]|uniref:Uncharacterized protein n=1 Tax=Candidatus Falkowbacteria bacterium CG10_big_fil_rev_8_21_14_0_10_43_11 TaxID=1974568 RepID=A0A2M6WLX8_9BACT|nr:MAG: hypothetical protein COU00_02620 [Candidatus Falkowbacteria bacterium CG10_big_fil_rev_8_21_14_0_10_43_11]
MNIFLGRKANGRTFLPLQNPFLFAGAPFGLTPPLASGERVTRPNNVTRPPLWAGARRADGFFNFGNGYNGGFLAIIL